MEGEAGHVLLADTQWTDFRADKDEGATVACSAA